MTMVHETNMTQALDETAYSHYLLSDFLDKENTTLRRK